MVFQQKIDNDREFALLVAKVKKQDLKGRTAEQIAADTGESVEKINYIINNTSGKILRRSGRYPWGDERNNKEK